MATPLRVAIQVVGSDPLLLATQGFAQGGAIAVHADLLCAYGVEGDLEQDFAGGPDGVPESLRKYAQRVREAWETSRAPQEEQKQGGEPETRDLHGVEVARSIRAPATTSLPSIDTRQIESDLARAREDVARLVSDAKAAIELDDEELALILALMD